MSGHGGDSGLADTQGERVLLQVGTDLCRNNCEKKGSGSSCNKSFPHSVFFMPKHSLLPCFQKLEDQLFGSTPRRPWELRIATI